jgi:mxaJ protein
MSLVCRLAAVVAAIAAAGAVAAGTTVRPPLRVCADPNNMPFSNERQQGFENKIAALLARDMGRPLAYFWSPQRRGFVRTTLNAQRCDVVIGVPANFGLLQTTRPYYRSAYAFVSRRERALHIRSFDDARLKTLTIGIQITGEDYANPPAAQALAARHLVQNVRGYTVYGDYSKPDPQRDIVDAVADGRVDIAVVWGPVAAYYARTASSALAVATVRPGGRDSSLPFAFDIGVGVRRNDTALRQAVDAAVFRRGREIRRILTSYGVPLL